MSTSDILVARGRQLAAGAGALTTAVALGAALLAAAPAHATPPVKPKPYGTVTAKSGVNERHAPSTDSASKGYLRKGMQVGLVCKVRAQGVMGNTVWYLTRDRHQTWVSAKFVTNSGSVKYCKDLSRSRVEPGDVAKNAKG